MKNILLTALAFFLWNLSVSAQEYPSFDEIEEKITDSTSHTYYPFLLERFNQLDTTLTFDEYILIYYGFGFQETYNGYRKDPIMEYFRMFNEGDYEGILKKCEEELQITPVCIASHFYKGKALEKLNPRDTAAYESPIIKSYILTDVLYYSGNGKTKESAFKVLFLADERRIMYGMLNLKGYNEQALIDHYDELTVEKSDKFDQTKIYFDVDLPLSGMMKSFKK